MTPELAAALARELSAAPYGGKEPIIGHWIASTGISRSTLLRHAKAAGYAPQKRKQRKDAGLSRRVSDEALKYMVALFVGSRRKTGTIEMPTTEALDICQRSGLIPKDVPALTICRILRERGISRRQLQAAYTLDGQRTSSFHKWLKTEHPNHMHEVDVSACLHWYFKKKGGLGMRHKQLDLAGGKKAAPYQKIRDHILRYVLVDHKTGAFYIRYYLAAGETALNLIDCLHHAWRRRQQPKDIFHGVPRILYLDKGSANLAQYMRTLMSNLDVELWSHQAGNARATGGVETYQKIWQQAFESKLWLAPPRDLEELNARADAFRIRHNAERINRTTGMTRHDAWSAIQAGQLRIVPAREIYNQLVQAAPHRTKVPADKIVHHRGAMHLLLDNLNLGEPIEVIRNPYQLPELLIYRIMPDGQRGPLLRSKYIADRDEAAVPVGTWQRHADAPAQTAMKKAAELDLAPLAAAAFEGHLDELPQDITHREPKGQEISFSDDAPAPAPLSITAALMQIKEAMDWHRISRLQNQALKKRLGTAPTQARVREVIADLQGQPQAQEAIAI